jgi:dephospho-CoA kinase
MLTVALTGNIAAGKSSVAALFQRWGATVIDADRLAREAQAPGTPGLAAIVERFGPTVLGAEGGLDRARLRALVVDDPAALSDLNAIVHPVVARRSEALLAGARARGDSVAVYDIPLLFEAADPGDFDAVVLVDAPEAVRLERLVRERGLASDEAAWMIAAQMPAADKRGRSDFVIENAGDQGALEAAAAAVWQAREARARA